MREKKESTVSLELTAVLGDGDTLMGVTALWTAVHYRIPLPVVVASNGARSSRSAAPGS